MAREIPYPVTFEELPPSWQAAVALAHPDPLMSPWILYIPSHTLTLRRGRVPAQALLFTDAGLIHVQGEPQATARLVRADEVLCVRHTMVLLYGRLDMDLRGQPSLHIEYNTVGERHLHQPLQRFLDAVLGVPVASGRDARTQALLQELEARSYAFKNGLALYALLPDESLAGYVWQPRVAGLLGRVRLPATLLALTPRAVLHLSEARIKGAAYGWAIGFYPRAHLREQRVLPSDPWQRLQWRLGGGADEVTCEALLSPSVVQAWLALLS